MEIGKDRIDLLSKRVVGCALTALQ